MTRTFTRSFIDTKWKESRKKIFIEKERALLPATQPILEKRRKADVIKQNAVETLELIRSLEEKYYSLMAEHRSLSGNTILETRNRNFIRACPEENCRGYLSTQWKCGLCNKYTCKECNIIKEENHECNPNDVETAKLIKNDTKPCPKCSFGIFKIEGCDQMWCTQCHTAFNWRTGNIESKIHNPHYFAYMRENGGLERNYNEGFVCGQQLNHTSASQILNKIRKMFNMPRSRYYRREYEFLHQNDEPEWFIKISDKISSFTMKTIHIREIYIPRYQVDDVENNVEYRIQYLDNKLNDKEFAAKLFQNNKRFEKNKEILEVLQMFVQTMTEIILRVGQWTTDFDINYNINPTDENKLERQNIFEEKTHEILDETSRLETYVNECLKDISITYKNVTKKLSLSQNVSNMNCFK
jgi:hypothetical protein